MLGMCPCCGDPLCDGSCCMWAIERPVVTRDALSLLSLLVRGARLIGHLPRGATHWNALPLITRDQANDGTSVLGQLRAESRGVQRSGVFRCHKSVRGTAWASGALLTVLVSACGASPATLHHVAGARNSRAAENSAISARRLASGTRRVAPAGLTRAERIAIIHAPHPYLRKYCIGPIGVLGARHTTLGARRVIVAQADCRDGTTGSPLETAVYGRGAGTWRQLYRLDSGRTIERRRVSIAALESFSARHHRVLLRYGGYTRRDPVCCPSRAYHRIFHVYLKRYTEGPLVRDS